MTAERWFQDKSVLVTGAGSGIGRTTARRFAEEGARVCVADVNAAAAERVAREIAARGGSAFACAVDVSQEADNQRMVAEVLRRHGGLDAAFLNAGTGGTAMDMLNGPVAEFDRLIAVNLRGCYLGVRAVYHAMRPGGAVVVTASVAGLTAFGFNAAYTASKFGVVGLVKSLAEDFAARGVRINALCPGGVRTAMTGFGADDLNAAPDALPMVEFRGRAWPEHMAETVLFLASNRAAGVNGSAMVVDAGQTGSFNRIPPQ